MFGKAMPVKAGLPSNRQRMRDADAAVARIRTVTMLLVSVLAQCGGEVVVTDGTVAQLQGLLSYEIVNTKPGERTIRLVVGEQVAA